MLEKLKTIKEIEPSQKTLESMKATIDVRIHKQPAPISSPYVRTSRIKFVTFSGGLVSAFVLFIVLQNSSGLEGALLSMRIGLAPHAHAQSMIAVAALEEKSNLVVEDAESYKNIENTLALSKKTLDTLELMGEKGKYTMEECLGDYTRYSKILATLNESLTRIPVPENEADKKKLEALKAQVYDAQEEAEDRLGKYSKTK